MADGVRQHVLWEPFAQLSQLQGKRVTLRVCPDGDCDPTNGIRTGTVISVTANAVVLAEVLSACADVRRSIPINEVLEILSVG